MPVAADLSGVTRLEGTARRGGSGGGDRRPALVSVVIPARNAAHTLREQLEALRLQDYGGAWEIVVADNGSTDGTAKVARGFAGVVPLAVVAAVSGRGPSVARNLGWRSARGDLIAFCDADDVVSPGWLSHLVEAARTADLVGGPYEFRRLNLLHGQPWWNGESPPLGLNFLPFLVGGNLAVWVDILAALGGFDEAYPRQQDVELCWRAQISSFELGFAPSAIVHCRHRTRFWALAWQAFHIAREQPHLYRDFRAYGVPRSSLREFARAVGSLVIQAPTAAATWNHRRRWALRASHQLGRLAGSLRYRVVYL